MKRVISFTIEVDKEDRDLLEKYVHKPRLLTSYLHREIALRFLGPKPEGYHVDHIDNNWTNNHRANLQYIPARKNMQKRARGNSGYYGVRKTKDTAYYETRIRYKHKYIYLGVYDTAIDAAYAVDNYLRSVGDSPINFPDLHIIPIRRFLPKSKTGYMGVHAIKGYYEARCKINGKQTHIGNYKKAIDAAKARDKFVIENKVRTILNFPEDYGL